MQSSTLGQIDAVHLHTVSAQASDFPDIVRQRSDDRSMQNLCFAISCLGDPTALRLCLQSQAPCNMLKTANAQDLSYSVISLTHSHTPFKFSFHNVTFPSLPDTASTLPLKLQLTLHNTASPKSRNVVANTQLFTSFGFVLVHIFTLLSCDALAMYVFESSVGDQATSLTQSLWPSGNDSCWTYVFC